MSKLLRAIANESVLLLAFVAALTTALDLSESWQNVVAAGVPLLLALVVRQITTSPATLVNVAHDVAQSLSGPAAGAVGTVTKNGEKVIDTVISEVGGLVPLVAPKLGEAA